MHSIDEVIVELRGFLSELSATHDSIDPLSALEPVIDEARKVSGLDVRWSADSIPCIPARSANHLVAFLRESLSNVARHVNARAAEVKVCCKNNRLNLTISDDGRGLPANLQKGYGMRDMLDRARLLGGKVSFTSTQQRGTTVSLDVPCEGEQ